MSDWLQGQSKRYFWNTKCPALYRRDTHQDQEHQTSQTLKAENKRYQLSSDSDQRTENIFNLLFKTGIIVLTPPTYYYQLASSVETHVISV